MTLLPGKARIGSNSRGMQMEELTMDQMWQIATDRDLLLSSGSLGDCLLREVTERAYGDSYTVLHMEAVANYYAWEILKSIFPQMFPRLSQKEDHVVGVTLPPGHSVVVKEGGVGIYPSPTTEERERVVRAALRCGLEPTLLDEDEDIEKPGGLVGTVDQFVAFSQELLADPLRS